MESISGGQDEVCLAEPAFLRSILDNCADLILVIDESATLTYVNGSSERILGYRSEDLIGRNALELVHPDDSAASRESLAVSVSGGSGAGDSLVIRVRHADGHWRQIEIVATDLLQDPVVGGLLVNARDVSDLRYAQMLDSTVQKTFAQAFHRSPIGMALTSVEGEYLRVNEAMCDLLSRTSEAMLTTSVLETTHPDDLRATVDAAVSLLDGRTESFSFEKRFLAAGGQPVWTRSTTTLLKDVDGRPLHFLTQVEDIEERRQLIEQLRRSALRDPLTGLANRAGLDEYLDSLPPETPIGVIALDLDRFKDVNDTSGHAAGDHVLRTVSHRIESSVRNRDQAARIGGDEFMVVCARPSSEMDFVALASRFISRIREPILLGECALSVGASAGIAVGLAGDASELMIRADNASYQSKRKGGDVVSSGRPR